MSRGTFISVMSRTIKILNRLSGLMLLVLILATFPVFAQDWDQGYAIRVTYQELEGGDYGSAEVTLSMTIPTGTPLISREIIVDNAFAALQDLWAVESVYEEMRGFLGPIVPIDIQESVSDITGSDFLTSIIDAFDLVEDAGYSRFQSDTIVSATEFIAVPQPASASVYPDPPRYAAWVIGEDWTDEELDNEKWVLAALINYSACVLSFRSEIGRFPNSFAELRETNHLLIEPLNPYTGIPVLEVETVNPGNISYEYIDNNHVVLMAFIDVGNHVDAVTRMINIPSDEAWDLLYRETAGAVETDKQVARYVFQIAQILNEYYYEHIDLPYSVPQLESEGFAYVSFINPYTFADVQQADSLGQIMTGDYTYHRISGTSYFLVGYGGMGQLVLSISKDFTTQEVRPGAISAR